MALGSRGAWEVMDSRNNGSTHPSIPKLRADDRKGAGCRSRQVGEDDRVMNRRIPPAIATWLFVTAYDKFDSYILGSIRAGKLNRCGDGYSTARCSAN